MTINRAQALGLCGFLINSLAFADGILTPTPHWKLVAGAGGGAAFSDNPGKSRYFPVTVPGSSQFYYYADRGFTRVKGLFEVFLGAEHPLFSQGVIQPALAYTQAASYQVKGVLMQGLDVPSSDNFTYQYRVLTRQLMAQSKFMLPFKQSLYPYLLLGVGASFNSASQYATNIPPLLISTRLYQNKQTTAFAYRLGLGVDVDLFSHVRLGAAYRFTGLGQACLGNTRIEGSYVPGTLSQPHMAANEVLLQLTYIG
ncbi:MAG: hypothetical protein WC785_01555 [Tatlockia sp.]